MSRIGAKRRSLHGERGLKYKRCAVCGQKAERRSLHGERGLK